MKKLFENYVSINKLYNWTVSTLLYYAYIILHYLKSTVIFVHIIHCTYCTMYRTYCDKSIKWCFI